MADMKVTDRIVAKPRGSIEEARQRAKNALRQDETQEYITHLFHYAVGAGVDPAIAFTQWDVETATGTSYWWKTRLNPAGLGITGTASQDNASWFFSPVTAAKAQVAHLLLYATGEINRGGLTPSDDPRYTAYRQAFGNRATATTIADLAGRWAADREYASTLVRRSRETWNPLPDFKPEKKDEPAQESVVPIVYPDGRVWDGKEPVVAGETVILPQQRTVSFDKTAKAYKFAEVGSAIVAPDYRVGQAKRVLGFFWTVRSGEIIWWWLTEDFHRVLADTTFDKPIF